jgi:arylsulfatase A-like enzyme
VPKLYADGKLDPVQSFLCQPRQPEEQLFDLTSDPHEIRNLVGSTQPEHAAALKRLRAELESWVLRTDDQGRFPEKLTAAEADAAVRGQQGGGGKKKKKA